MTIHSVAVYKDGVLHPKKPLPVPDGTEVELAVDWTPRDEQQPTLADRLASIAAMPLETDDQNFSGADHDRVLYGAKRTP